MKEHLRKISPVQSKKNLFYYLKLKIKKLFQDLYYKIINM